MIRDAVEGSGEDGRLGWWVWWCWWVVVGVVCIFGGYGEALLELLGMADYRAETWEGHCCLIVYGGGLNCVEV